MGRDIVSFCVAVALAKGRVLPADKQVCDLPPCRSKGGLSRPLRHALRWGASFTCFELLPAHFPPAGAAFWQRARSISVACDTPAKASVARRLAVAEFMKRQRSTCPCLLPQPEGRTGAGTWLALALTTPKNDWDGVHT